MSDNTPTREQIQQATDWFDQQTGAMVHPVHVAFAAARLWLEAPTDEMIERGAMVLEQKLWASSSWSHDMSEAVLRAALEEWDV